MASYSMLMHSIGTKLRLLRVEILDEQKNSLNPVFLSEDTNNKHKDLVDTL